MRDKRGGGGGGARGGATSRATHTKQREEGGGLRQAENDGGCRLCSEERRAQCTSGENKAQRGQHTAPPPAPRCTPRWRQTEWSETLGLRRSLSPRFLLSPAQCVVLLHLICVVLSPRCCEVGGRPDCGDLFCRGDRFHPARGDHGEAASGAHTSANRRGARAAEEQPARGRGAPQERGTLWQPVVAGTAPSRAAMAPHTSAIQ